MIKASKLLPALAARGFKALARGVAQLPARAADFFSVLQSAIKNPESQSPLRNAATPQVPAAAPTAMNAKLKNPRTGRPDGNSQTKEPVERRKVAVDTGAGVSLSASVLSASVSTPSSSPKTKVTAPRPATSFATETRPTVQGLSVPTRAAQSKVPANMGANPVHGRASQPEPGRIDSTRTSQSDSTAPMRVMDKPWSATPRAETIIPVPAGKEPLGPTSTVPAPSVGKTTPQPSGATPIQPLAALRTDRLGGADSRMPQAEFILGGDTPAVRNPAAAVTPRSSTRPRDRMAAAPMEQSTEKSVPTEKPLRAEKVMPVDKATRTDRPEPVDKPARTEKPAVVEKNVRTEPPVSADRAVRAEKHLPNDKSTVPNPSVPADKAQPAENAVPTDRSQFVARSFWGLKVSPQPLPVPLPAAMPAPAAQKSVELTLLAPTEPVKIGSDENSKSRPGTTRKLQSADTQPAATKLGDQKSGAALEFRPPLPESPLKTAVAPVPGLKPHPMELTAQVKVGDRPPQNATSAEPHKTLVTEKSAPPESRADATPSAVNAETAPTHDAPATSAEAVPLRPRYTPEQIRELQNLAAKAISAARMTAAGNGEAAFQWRHDELGVLSFRITTCHDDVSVEISSSRTDVVDSLNEGRGVMERMITDVGLRIERFDVHVRGESASPDLHHEPQDPAKRQRQTEQGSEATTGGEEPVAEAGQTTETPRRRASFAEREWVA